MAIQRERLHRKNASGEYDTIHLETQADLILLASDPSKNVEQILGETVSIAKGGTGATTAAAGLYNLMAGLLEMTAEELAEDDLLCVLDVDANSAKKIALSVVGIGGGSTPEEPVTNPNWPNKSDLTLNNRIWWADNEWVVVEVTGTEAYLALEGLYCGKMSGGGWYPGGGGSETTDVPHVTFYNLQQQCDNFLNDTFTAEQQKCLKTIRSNELQGKVFAPTYDQVNGQFARYRSDFGRTINQGYWMDHPDLQYESWWTSEKYWDEDGTATTESYAIDAEDGRIKTLARSLEMTLRPHVCIDLSVYEGGGQ